MTYAPKWSTLNAKVGDALGTRRRVCRACRTIHTRLVEMCLGPSINLLISFDLQLFQTYQEKPQSDKPNRIRSRRTGRTTTMFERIITKLSKTRRSSQAEGVLSIHAIPTINEPAPDKNETSPWSRSRATSTTSDSNYLAPPSPSESPFPSSTEDSHRNTSSRRRSSAPDTSPVSSTGRRRRLRDSLWGVGLWDETNVPPLGATVRASSQSTSVLHPTVAEEQMRGMYRRWRL